MIKFLLDSELFVAFKLVIDVLTVIVPPFINLNLSNSVHKTLSDEISRAKRIVSHSSDIGNSKTQNTNQQNNLNDLQGNNENDNENSLTNNNDNSEFPSDLSKLNQEDKTGIVYNFFLQLLFFGQSLLDEIKSLTHQNNEKNQTKIVLKERTYARLLAAIAYVTNRNKLPFTSPDYNFSNIHFNLKFFSAQPLRLLRALVWRQLIYTDSESQIAFLKANIECAVILAPLFKEYFSPEEIPNEIKNIDTQNAFPIELENRLRNHMKRLTGYIIPC